MGRSLKYAYLLKQLEDHRLYSAATIANLETGADSTQKHKIVKSLSRLTKRHGFPNLGDGWIEIKGQAPTRGFYGERWKTLLKK